MRVNPLALVMLLPLIEIASCIVVGQAIGLGPTLLLLILGAIVGMALIRSQGQGALRDLAAFAEQRKLPEASLAIRLRLALAGALFIVPGFVSDIGALVLLLLPRRIGSWQTPGGGSTGSGSTIIEGEYRIVENDPRHTPAVESPDRASPWRKDGESNP